MKFKLLYLLLFFAPYTQGQITGIHSYAIDLTQVEEDRVKVTRIVVDSFMQHQVGRN